MSFSTSCIPALLIFSRWSKSIGFLLLLCFGTGFACVPLAAQTEARKPIEDPFGTEHLWFLARAVDAANRKLSHELTGEAWEQAVVDACDLYVLLKRNPSIAQSPTLQGKLRKLRAVLKNCQTDLENNLSFSGSRRADAKRASLGAAPVPAAARESESPKPSSGTSLATDPLGRALLPPKASQEETRNNTSGEAQLLEWEAESAHWKMVYQLAPGPGQILSRSGGAVVGDGSNLIQLIQTTVTPHTWDVNGGPSTIQYYQRVHALVVRAPWMTHLETERRLGQLRD